ncbi:MAG: calcium-binding EGF-like domain-containing protein [Myxococcota bacterium]
MLLRRHGVVRLVQGCAAVLVVSACTGDGGSDLSPTDAGTGAPPPSCTPRTWYADGDGDGVGIASASVSACAPPPGHAAIAGDNCPHAYNPEQWDADGDGLGDACDATPSHCEDLAETAISSRFTAVSADGASATIHELVGDDVSISGSRAVRVVSQSGAYSGARFSPGVGNTLDLRLVDEVRLAVRGRAQDPLGWQGPPVVVIEDAQGRRAQLWPTSTALPNGTGAWTTLAAPLRLAAQGGSVGGWGWSGQLVDLARVRALEVAVDVWGAGMELDVDGMTLAAAAQSCAWHCPANCHGRGACQLETLSCECDLGSTGRACEACAAGFVESEGRCVLANDGEYDTWPNPVSFRNSDPWLVVHHAKIRQLRPRVLVLNYVNPSAMGDVQQLIDDLRRGFRESSRALGDPNALPQLDYQLARPIVDLRDGYAGHPAPPAGYPHENSTLLPRRPANEAGEWRMDYATLFDPAYAAHYGFTHPDAPGQFMDLCTLVERGHINEVWLVISGEDPTDVNMAEVLEAKPRYSATGNLLPGEPERCAGNGCYDVDVPVCGRSLRIGAVNYRRGPGCYLHSQGHGLESVGARGTVPTLTSWFVPFAGFDLDSRLGLPVSNLYGLTCSDTNGDGQSDPPCVSYPDDDTAHLFHAGNTYRVNPYDGACGNVHFPPNATWHYDYANTDTVRSTCLDFGLVTGEEPAPRTLVGSALWSANEAVTGDCGGGYLTWWFQRMPGFGTGHVYRDGRLMLSVWPHLFY